MERQVPDVFDVFALGSSPPPPPPGAVALPGMSRDRETWELRLRAQGRKWSDRRSSCERPRTYDKFYQKTPGNFMSEQERDSAISVCSSDEGEPEKEKGKKRRRPRRSRSERRVRNRTLTEQDVKHLERHLSMKRTIRKKIMQDLQHAFVRTHNREEIHIRALDVQGELQPNVLDLLRDSDDSGNYSPSRKPKFLSLRGRTRRRMSSGSSSETRDVRTETDRRQDRSNQGRKTGSKHREESAKKGDRLREPTPDYCEVTVQTGGTGVQTGGTGVHTGGTSGKRSFWQKLVSLLWRRKEKS